MADSDETRTFSDLIPVVTVLDAEAFDALMVLLDQPPEENPKLKKLLEEHGVLDGGVV